MKPRIQCVLTQWNPGFTAPGSGEPAGGIAQFRVAEAVVTDHAGQVIGLTPGVLVEEGNQADHEALPLPQSILRNHTNVVSFYVKTVARSTVLTNRGGTARHGFGHTSAGVFQQRQR